MEEYIAVALRTLLSAMTAMMLGDSGNLTNNKIAFVKYAGSGVGDQDVVQLVDIGQVLQVGADGKARVQVRGQTFSAGQATDEPLQAGQAVYVSPVGTRRDDTVVIHGGV